MTDPGTEPTYLEEAADELRKARSANEARASGRSWLTGADVPVIIEVNQRRMEIAAAFTRLAAIDAGVPQAGHDSDSGAGSTT